MRWLDPEAQGFTFQTFDDSPAKRRELARVLHGSLDACWATLCDYSARGAGVYITVNRTTLTGRRIRENITGVRALFADLDGAPLTNSTRLGIEPHACAATSPGKFHLYWKVDGVTREEFPGFQKRLAKLLDGDPAVSDLPRVMRVPGFPHQKREPFIVKAAYNDAPTHSRVEFIAALAAAGKERGITVEVPRKRNGRPPALPDEAKAGRVPRFNGEAPPFLRQPLPADLSQIPIIDQGDLGGNDPPAPFSEALFEEIKSALYGFDPDCQYQEWRDIGFALHWASQGTGWDDRLIDLFFTWSRTARKNYDDRQWGNIISAMGSYKGKPLTLGTFFKRAVEERGWPGNPALATRVVEADEEDEEDETDLRSPSALPPNGAEAEALARRLAVEQDEEGSGEEGTPAAGALLPPGYAAFWAYAPDHSYIYEDGAKWMMAGVNAQLPSLFELDVHGQPRRDAKSGRKLKIKPSTWLDRHKRVQQKVWMPGLSRIIEGGIYVNENWVERKGCRCFNTYCPPIIVPGDARKAGPWLELVEWLYPAEWNHLIQYLAQRLQQPGVKPNHVIVLGGNSGVGKDSSLVPVKAGVGPGNFKEITPQDLLRSNFNEYVQAVMLRISEARDTGDVRINRFQFYAHLKSIATSPPDVIRVNPKYDVPFQCQNVMGVVITTNDKDSLFIPDYDRRFFVAWSERKKEDFAEDYWRQLYAWYESGGISHVVAYLHGVDLKDFDPKAPPPQTDAWREIVGNAIDTAEDAELADALEKAGNPAVITIRELEGLSYDTSKFFDELQE